MNLKSIKCGGTSMGSAESIQECAKIVKEKINKSLVVVTVSAVGGITDKLIEIIKLARKTKPSSVFFFAGAYYGFYKFVVQPFGIQML